MYVLLYVYVYVYVYVYMYMYIYIYIHIYLYMTSKPYGFRIQGWALSLSGRKHPEDATAQSHKPRKQGFRVLGFRV